MSKNIQACFSSNTDNWRTPSWLYDFFVINTKRIDLFPYCSTYDQYEINYFNESLFCNPPFSQMNKVVDYLIKQYNNGCNIVLLCPARTDTNWFHKLLTYSPMIIFLKGRLHFNDYKGCAPFPTILMFLDHNSVLPLWSWDLFSSLKKIV